MKDSLRLGWDVDGVLANFTDSYASLITERTGIVFPKNSSSWPTEWYWDRAAGLQKADETALWWVVRNSAFWGNLQPLPNAINILAELNELRHGGVQVYFITTRPGKHAKYLTEIWLTRMGMANPTVLIAENETAKGTMAKSLGLDFFVDDKPENCAAVADATWTGAFNYPCKIYLADAPYNRSFSAAGVERTTDVLASLKAFVTEELLDVAA